MPRVGRLDKGIAAAAKRSEPGGRVDHSVRLPTFMAGGKNCITLHNTGILHLLQCIENKVHVSIDLAIYRSIYLSIYLSIYIYILHIYVFIDR